MTDLSKGDLPVDVDVVVVGAGLMGSSAAWHLTSRGHEVLVLEQFEPATPRGSSHGSARITRRAYPEDDYVRLTGEAFEWWREVEHQSGTALLRMTGGLDHGSWREPEVIAASLKRAGVEHELLQPEEAQQRFPGMVFELPVLYHSEAGTVDAESAVLAFIRSATDGGARVETGIRVRSLTMAGRGAVVHTDCGDVRARVVVVAAGGWVEELTSGLVTMPPVFVTEHRVFHFPQDESVTWPVTLHRDVMDIYHLPGGRDGGPGDARKIAEHQGFLTTADSRKGVVDDESRQRIVDYVQRWLPGLVPEPFAETTCLYTSTPTEDFLIDRVGPVVVASACSGHGAKLAPTVGRLVADLVDGKPQDVDRFRLSRHLNEYRPGDRPSTIRMPASANE